MVKGLCAAALIVMAVGAHGATQCRAPAFDGRTLAIRGIHLYQRSLAPIAGVLGARCRFDVSCSHYAETAIAREGLMRGGWKAAKRIARCNPLTPMGTRD
jgi:putative membrane protein insertion efficiency factor